MEPTDELKQLLQSAWNMAFRAYYLEGAAYNKVDQFNVTKRIFACTEPLHDEDWWLHAKRNMDKQIGNQMKDVVEQELQQEAQRNLRKDLHCSPRLCKERGRHQF